MTAAKPYPQLGAGRGGAVGKRSRMRPGLPDHFNMRLQRPLLGDDKAGTDITHVDVRFTPLLTADHCWSASEHACLTCILRMTAR